MFEKIKMKLDQAERLLLDTSLTDNRLHLVTDMELLELVFTKKFSSTVLSYHVNTGSTLLYRVHATKPYKQYLYLDHNTTEDEFKIAIAKLLDLLKETDNG